MNRPLPPYGEHDRRKLPGDGVDFERPRHCVGVDPGGKHTGICIVRLQGRWIADEPVAGWDIVTRKDDEPVAEYAERAHHRMVVMLWEAAGARGGSYFFAIEGLNPPTAHMGMTNVKGLLDTARVLGYLECALPRVVLVPPANHGGDLLLAYPKELVAQNERKGTGKRRHARSAYDVALSAISTRYQPKD